MARRVRALTAIATLAVLAVGVPVLLARIGGWPLPRHVPHWDRVITALRQGDIPAATVIKTIAVLVWMAWTQLMWALGWELAVNVPATTRGRRPQPAPLVATSVSAGIARLVAVALTLTLAGTATASPALGRRPCRRRGGRTTRVQSSDSIDRCHPRPRPADVVGGKLACRVR